MNSVIFYASLLFSVVLLIVQSIVTHITSLLPDAVIDMCTRVTRKIFMNVTNDQIDSNAPPEVRERVTKLICASGFVEMCASFGYEAEEHVVQTRDGYILCLHRIGGGKNSQWRRRQAGKPLNKPVVYLHHGLLMNSEIWVCHLKEENNIPFVLAELGYDVWLGNNRGNKYSRKHISRTPDEVAFWNFSIDDFAIYDIPDSIDYILGLTGQKDLTCIGFSQGSAQSFAALSINPSLASKVKLFIALAPAMAPPGLRNRVVDSLMKASPSLMYLFFGRRAILDSTVFWQSIMYPPLFIKVIDLALVFLFNWRGDNISFYQKMASYEHLYSYTSVKSVVHWFQIMRTRNFQLFDDSLRPGSSATDNRHYRVAPFPTENIVSPIVLIYGKSDSLVDIDSMLRKLPPGTIAVGVQGYEHLDIIWGDAIDQTVIPHIASAIAHSGVKPPAEVLQSLYKVNGGKRTRAGSVRIN